MYIWSYATVLEDAVALIRLVACTVWFIVWSEWITGEICTFEYKYLSIFVYVLCHYQCHETDGWWSNSWRYITCMCCVIHLGLQLECKNEW